MVYVAEMFEPFSYFCIYKFIADINHKIWNMHIFSRSVTYMKINFHFWCELFLIFIKSYTITCIATWMKCRYHFFISFPLYLYFQF